MEIKSIYELAKDDLITWLPLKNIFFNEFHYSQNFGKLGLCGCPGTLLDSNNQIIGIQKTLKIFKNHNVNVVLSLTETSELKSLGCGNLIKEIKLNNFVWLHFPINDFNIPPKNSLLKLNFIP